MEVRVWCRVTKRVSLSNSERRGDVALRDTVGFSNKDLAGEMSGMWLGSPLLIATQSLILEALSMTLTVASISSNLPIRT